MAKSKKLLNVIKEANLHGCELKCKEVVSEGLYKCTLKAGGQELKFTIDVHPGGESFFFSPQRNKGFNSKAFFMSDLKRKVSSVCKKFSTVAAKTCETCAC